MEFPWPVHPVTHAVLKRRAVRALERAGFAFADGNREMFLRWLDLSDRCVRRMTNLRRDGCAHIRKTWKFNGGHPWYICKACGTKVGETRARRLN